MTYKLFIDDERFPPDSWVGGNYKIARSSSEAIAFVEDYGMPNFISFDHDLGGDDTSMRFIGALISMLLDGFVVIPKDFDFYVHSQNPVGAGNIRARMLEIISHFGKDVNVCSAK